MDIYILSQGVDSHPKDLFHLNVQSWLLFLQILLSTHRHLWKIHQVHSVPRKKKKKRLSYGDNTKYKSKMKSPFHLHCLGFLNHMDCFAFGLPWTVPLEGTHHQVKTHFEVVFLYLITPPVMRQPEISFKLVPPR